MKLIRNASILAVFTIFACSTGGGGTKKQDGTAGGGGAGGAGGAGTGGSGTGGSGTGGSGTGGSGTGGNGGSGTGGNGGTGTGGVGGTGTGGVGGTDGGMAMRWPGDCDPVKQDCDPGKACDFNQCMGPKAFVCIADEPPGTKKVGESCGAAGAICLKGLTCIGATMADLKCFKFCESDADCAGKTCNMMSGLVCDDMDMMPIGWFCNL